MADEAGTAPTLGELIKDRRENLGLTQADLGRQIGVTHKTISAWETGLRTPDSPAALGRLAAGLDIHRGTAEYAALRTAWTMARRRAAPPSGTALAEATPAAPPPTPPLHDGPTPQPGDEPRAQLRGRRLRIATRMWLTGGAVLLAFLAGIALGGVLARPAPSLDLLPGYVLATATATACAPTGCAVYATHLTQAYQRSALARQVHLISALGGEGRTCTVTPASVSAQITACTACRSSLTDMSHEYAFMVYTVTLSGRHPQKRATMQWLRLDYTDTAHTWSTHGSGTPPAWTHPRHC